MSESQSGSQRPDGSRSRPYLLNYPPDGTSYTVRENMVDILQRELLGPINGPTEKLPFSPRSQYLVGYIAPVKVDATRAGADVEDDAMPADPAALAMTRGVPVDEVEEPTTDDKDDDAEDRVPRQGLIMPSSMGLRFQVPADLESFTVTASWGRYDSVTNDQVPPNGGPTHVYQRTPVEVPRTVRLAELHPGRTHTEWLQESICLRIDRYNDVDRCLIEIALCNDRETPIPIPLSLWMFQTQLRVSAAGAEVFLPVRDVLEQDWPEPDPEVERLNLQYRDRLEFAVGRTCSADWVVRKGARRATEVSTTWLPVAETPQTLARSVDGALLSMDALSHASAQDLRAGLEPLIRGYGDWLDTQEATAAALPQHLRTTAEVALWEARQAHQRLVAGLDHITSDKEALLCFQFMNRVMRDQRIASLVSQARSSDSSLSLAEARAALPADADGQPVASWRPFQLAFILMQVAALTDPASPQRSGDHLAQVELLFFPTGGGKTEAYLGLAAYTFAIRRRQGIVSSAEGPLQGNDGVAVLMRYTLRLLTAQQFQRATALVCAAELARLEDAAVWGAKPFRSGLWVGTDVSPKRFDEAKKQLQNAHEYGAHRLTVLQLQRCPWCGTPISAKDITIDEKLYRVFVRCGDDLARCPFAKGGQVAEGLPVLTVDEEIYRLTPAFVIATVDKFARLAREGEAAALFGYVARRCTRHGYVHPDSRFCTTASHSATGRHPAAKVVAVDRLRPPDLIIQDELHLITGALGTCVGLFEAAIEVLCSWQTSAGQPVRPMIVASTATVRNAVDQVRGLYGRQVRVFPPQVLDVADTFFSYEIEPSQDHPGRRYVGVSAQGVRLSQAEIRVAEVLLLSGQLLFDHDGIAADPYLTLIGYFNATRELAGMTRYLADDVTRRVKNPRSGSGFTKRLGVAKNGLLSLGELTSRIASTDIGKTLDQLSLSFEPDYDTTRAFQARMAKIKAGRKLPVRSEVPFDAVLATSMLQVGVDVQRLGLMLVVGQPKNTAEYIQASSRVGRDASRPGLVVSLGNWARPRDLAHFEQFRHYHETFYAQVEALSVTPYSPTSLDRGIDALLVSAVRVLQAPLADGLSPEKHAGRIEEQHDAVTSIAERLTTRIAAAAQDEKAAQRASQLLTNSIERWTTRRRQAEQRERRLVYERTEQGDDQEALIMSSENARLDGTNPAIFVIANSMREVQPEINVLVSPIPERLYSDPSDQVSDWVFPQGDDQ